MRLDHLLSKETSSEKDIVYFSMYFISTLKNRVKLIQKIRTTKTLINGLIAQMVRAHA